MGILRILIALIVLGILIFIHEFGHYFVGRLCGIGVKEFAVGFGPKVFGWEKNGIKYSLRAIPLGGFTAFEGEDEESDSPTAMNNVSVWKRLATVVAGPAVNIIFAFIITVALLSSYGEVNTRIVEVADNSPAMEMGIEQGDKVLSINGKSTVFSMEALSQLYRLKSKDQPITIVLDRNGEEITKVLRFDENGKIGIGMGEVQTYSTLDAVKMSARWSYAIFYETFASLGGLFTGTYSMQDVGGTVAIVDTIGTAATLGIYPLLQITVIISLSLGIMNLLPIPALDGGRIVFLIIEGIRRKPINRDLEAKIHFGGMVVLFGLMLLLIGNDIINIFVRGS